MRASFRTRLLVLVSVLGVLTFSLPGSAAPPGNWTNYNLDINGDFDTNRLGDPASVHFEGHGNDPEGWPTTMEFWIEIQTDGYQCSYYEPAQSFTDNGDYLTIQFEDVSDCGTDWQFTLVIDHEAVRYRSHTNETGGQVKANGVRDDSADVSLDIMELNNGWEHIIDAEAPNSAFYQAVTEQFHNTGTPGNPQP